MPTWPQKQLEKGRRAIYGSRASGVTMHDSFAVKVENSGGTCQGRYILCSSAKGD